VKTKRDSFNILALHEAADEVEQLMNELRNNGVAARPTVVDDVQSLSQLINDNDYDLILSQPEIDGFEVTEVLEQIQRLGKNLPIICLIEEHDVELIESLLSEGIANVVPINEPHFCGFMIKRELEHMKSQQDKAVAELHLAEAERRCTLLLASSRDAIAYVADGMHILANQSYIDLFKFEDPDEVNGLPLMDIIDGKSHEPLKEAMRALMQDQLSETQCDITCLTSEGEKLELTCDILPALYEGERCMQLMLHKHRVSEEDLKLKERLEELSKRCPITGLWNRQYFETEVDKVLEEVKSEEKEFDLFYVHLEDLAKNRAKIGVDGIDLVAKETSDLLKENFPENSILARLSEDNFAALVEKTEGDDLDAMGQSMCSKIKNHLFECDNASISLSSNVGIASLDDNTKSAKQAISQAFSSCNEAAMRGKHISHRFVKAKEDVIADQTASAQQLQKAIDNNLFKILFQPIISMLDSEAEFYEVLLRRVSEDGKLESPEAFLETAQAAKVATIVDRWVILQSVKALITKRMEGKNTKMIINLTTQSLLDSTFLPWLTVALKATRLPPKCVVFQVVSDAAVEYTKKVQELGNALAELDCQLSISRFGTEEEAKELLGHIKPSYTKVDSVFTKELHMKKGKENLKKLLQTVHTASASSILTFVEDAATLATLWQLGAHYMQGYYLQPPMESMTYDFSPEEDEV